VTLGALGGTLKPLTRAQLLALPPVVNLVTLGQALGVSEPVIRERARRGELEQLGIRCLRLGAQYRIPTADILRLLGIELDTETAGPAPPGPADHSAVAPPPPSEDTSTHERTSAYRRSA
jgi:hypothetical protein